MVELLGVWDLGLFRGVRFGVFGFRFGVLGVGVLGFVGVLGLEFLRVGGLRVSCV